ncbi:carbamoyl-phosphate synthase large subunit [Natranaerobius trueperi]|uniref:Carbamoyl phosphate synthase large chain n=1 Tax=Natranaerobius trueperi TaxID=759412 RepID=A0A226BWB3_9FIRM|nr:carbamoyl-phosphate synthase large subunit [Natranaerobius trueperi]OWZ83191.1 carbamoyl phosphate synthase large subunit [Natranaerobius trueperi]
MGKDNNLNKILVIGSGPIVIGQAVEFDYAGTQACSVLKEEGYEVILVNSNPATIMTDTTMADKVYLEPLTLEYLKEIIKKERPCGLLATLGGQVGLNLSMELKESKILDEYNVKLLGTSTESIKKAEDRDIFKNTMNEINEPIAESKIVSSVDGALTFASTIGYPVIIRPAYTLGGTGGGVCRDEEELKEIALSGLKNSPIDQILVERCITGWKEVEYEVIRDNNDNCITICNMENIDPVGVHTGDSIVTAPSQTLTDKDHQMLRSASIKIIRELGIKGGCNIQFALDPYSRDYYVIEVNPRVSRSSALASKATGYPIARVATMIALGYNLDEIQNQVTGTTSACFEPTLDYIVLKLPRFPFDKFNLADRKLGTQMKATGEVMAIGRNFESAFMKALRSLEIDLGDLYNKDLTNLKDEDIITNIQEQTDERILWIFHAIRKEIPLSTIHSVTEIDRYFLAKIKNLVDLETKLTKLPLDNEFLQELKEYGFTDEVIENFASTNNISKIRSYAEINPTYKMVDTCAAEYEANTPYYYSSYEKEDEVLVSQQDKVIVLGSGPIRIGQGVEFDYCSVHSAQALKELGYEAVIINNNPETVSTDFNISDKLYFEPLTCEDVMGVIKKEKPTGVITQFGGQTAVNLARPLNNLGTNILGTSVSDMDRAEDRDKFDKLLQDLDLDRPKGKTARTSEEALKIAEEIGFPIVIRPSYVLGGQAMEIIRSSEELKSYINWVVKVSPDYPILLDKFIQGIELEVDAVYDGENVLIPGIMEHIEKAGVHSGDSMAVFPSISLTKELKDKIEYYTENLAKGLNVKGIINIQYAYHDNKLYVIEVNPRSSRTVPFISKVTGLPLVKIATKVMMGYSIKNQGITPGLHPEPNYYSVKAPVFSFAKLAQVDTTLGPEMKSTGEVLGIDYNLDSALYKAMIASGFNITLSGGVLVTVADRDKKEVTPLVRNLKDLGLNIYATPKTASYLSSQGIEVEEVSKIQESSPNLLDLIQDNKIQYVINTFTKGKEPTRDGFKIRRAAVENGIPCLTSIDTSKVLVNAIKSLQSEEINRVQSLQEYLEKGE